MGLSARPLSRYSRRRPSSRTATAPTSRSTRRCLDTCGCARPTSATRSPTGRSPPARASRISRRRGSAMALNASAVVAARAMARDLTFPYRNMSSAPALLAYELVRPDERADRADHGDREPDAQRDHARAHGGDAQQAHRDPAEAVRHAEHELERVEARHEPGDE